jgi:hypothetical protein
MLARRPNLVDPGVETLESPIKASLPNRATNRTTNFGAPSGCPLIIPALKWIATNFRRSSSDAVAIGSALVNRKHRAQGLTEQLLGDAHKNAREKPVRPCVAITMTSATRSVATLRIEAAGLPRSIRTDSRRPADACVRRARHALNCSEFESAHF